MYRLGLADLSAGQAQASPSARAVISVLWIECQRHQAIVAWQCIVGWSEPA